MDNEQLDERFAHILKDPRFKNLKKSERKVKVDKRFRRMLKDESFDLTHCDKRGKPSTSSRKEDLSRFYDLSSDDDQSDESENTEEPQLIPKPKIPDARGENNDDFSESSDDDDDSEESNEESEEIDHQWGEFDKDAKRSDEVSKKLAVCNIDWDRINATDLYVLFNSFKPAEGTIISVKIYLSEFGKKRLEEEKVKGPTELVEVTLDDEEEDPYKKRKVRVDEDPINNESSYITEKLRKYQLNRLKYYYAVVECDSVETAIALYDELDGMEYESSASALDLRFIPEDECFNESPKSECTSMPDFISYKPPVFITTALQQSKVQLTWDETDPKRNAKFQKAFQHADKDDIKDDDIRAYLATDESSEDEDLIEERENLKQAPDSCKLDKYKSLLKSLEEKKDEKEDLDLKVTWEPSLKNFTENLVSEKQREKDMTVFEKERKDKKQKKKRKQVSSDTEQSEDKDVSDNEDTLDLVTMTEEDDKKHFNYEKFVINNAEKNKAKKKLKPAEDDFKVDLEDARFSAIYTSSDYNIDQSNPHFKRTKAIEEMLKHKQEYISKAKKSALSKTDDKCGKNSNLSTLVNSIKSKTRSDKRFGKR
ncbi:ESF1-like protein [Dinothrombium tinctorium]|uniref:ESF1-like protein n=1 Tax=Dinothrombium tinctorium TaxID=1965070 RepID=A0A3S4Q8E1_9ACAR|nr:ESF1-like protein [Dinothrombium tinctorium]